MMMNAPFLTPIQGGKSLQPMETADVQMEQVRELLIGEHQRETAAQLAGLASQIRELEARVLARLDNIESSVETKFAALTVSNENTERKIIEVATEAAAARRAALDALSQGVNDLTLHIQRIARP
jgi:uncharacterized membrane protein